MQNLKSLTKCFICLVCMVTTISTASGQVINSAVPHKIPTVHLPNALQVHAKVISGGMPDGEEAFRELKELGVKTIVSVDGAKPDLEKAHRFGMKYIHLPHGYDGIADGRIQELAKVVRDIDGPIYIHCHHGKHRSPTAAAVACVGSGLIQPAMAMSVLQFAGTSENYRGLFEAAKKAKRLDDAALDRLSADFPETAKLPPMAESMVAIENTHDNLKRFAALQWHEDPQHPGLDPAHEALLLKEHFAELLRLDEVVKANEKYRAFFRDSLKECDALEQSLRNWIAGGRKTALPSNTSKTMQAITANCQACHKQFRDVPLSEK